MKRQFSVKLFFGRRLFAAVAATCSVAATLGLANQQIVDAPPPADFVLGPSTIIGRVGLARNAAWRARAGHRRHLDAVFQGKRFDTEGFEQG